MYLSANVACSLGGLLVGVAGTLIYAKVTGQEIEWRRKAITRWIYCKVTRTPRRAH